MTPSPLRWSAVLSLLTLSSFAGPSLLAPRTFPAGIQPVSAAVADLNGDGVLDLVVGGTGVSVILGNVDGTFRAPVVLSDDFQYGVAVADLNGDGKPDIVTSGGATYLGRGDGTFRAVTPALGQGNPGPVAVQDFDGDGKLDIATVSPERGKLSIAMGNGDGSLRQAVSYDAGGTPYSLVSADFNHDGHPDVAVLIGGAVVLFTNAGDGTMQKPVKAGDAAQPLLSLTCADYNGDGLSDLAVLAPDLSAVNLLINRGNGVFDVRAIPLAGTVGSVWSADVDGNGTPDLIADVAIDGGDFQIVLANNGNAVFHETQRFLAIGIPAIADLDRDGRLDLIALSYHGSWVAVARGEGAGRFDLATSMQAGFRQGNQFQGHSVATADVNGDAVVDLVASNTDNTISVFLGTGRGGFAPATNYPGPGPSTIRLGDVNGDGRPDIVAEQSVTKTLTVLLSSGAGKFAPGVVNASSISDRVLDMVLADVNGDGASDALFFTVESIFVALSHKDGTFSGAVAVSTVSRGPLLGFAAGDFDGDGKIDIVVAPVSGGLVFFKGKGDGTFAAGMATATGNGNGQLVAGDLNGDGILDIVSAMSDRPLVGTWIGNGDGTFQRPHFYESRPGPTAPLIVDVDGDHIPDVVVANNFSDEISVYHGNGDGTLQPAVTFASVPLPSSIAIGDFNGDGKADIAVSGGPLNEIALLMNDSVTSAPRRRAVHPR